MEFAQVNKSQCRAQLLDFFRSPKTTYVNTLGSRANVCDHGSLQCIHSVEWIPLRTQNIKPLFCNVLYSTFKHFHIIKTSKHLLKMIIVFKSIYIFLVYCFNRRPDRKLITIHGLETCVWCWILGTLKVAWSGSQIWV